MTGLVSGQGGYQPPIVPDTPDQSSSLQASANVTSTSEALLQQDTITKGDKLSHTDLIQQTVDASISEPQLPTGNSSALSKTMNDINNNIGDVLSGTSVPEEEGQQTDMSLKGFLKNTYNNLSGSTTQQSLFERLTDKQAGGSNPWIGGFVAQLSSLLSDIQRITEDMILKDAKLKTALMSLYASMAKEAYNAQIKAGEAQVKQLQLEMAQHIGMAVASFLQAGMTVGVGMLQQKAMSDAQMEATEAGAGKDAQIMAASTASQKYQTVTQVSGSIFEAAKSALQGAFTGAKEGAVMDQATEQAIKDFEDKMIQLVQSSMQSIDSDMQGAKDFYKGLIDSVIQLFDKTGAQR